jgi:hypothetical protein
MFFFGANKNVYFLLNLKLASGKYPQLLSDNVLKVKVVAFSYFKVYLYKKITFLMLIKIRTLSVKNLEVGMNAKAPMMCRT